MFMLIQILQGQVGGVPTILMVFGSSFTRMLGLYFSQPETISSSFCTASWNIRLDSARSSLEADGQLAKKFRANFEI
jgi:hypothetical protein